MKLSPCVCICVRVRVCTQGNTTLICVVERLCLSGESAGNQLRDKHTYLLFIRPPTCIFVRRITQAADLPCQGSYLLLSTCVESHSYSYKFQNTFDHQVDTQRCSQNV